MHVMWEGMEVVGWGFKSQGARHRASANQGRLHFQRVFFSLKLRYATLLATYCDCSCFASYRCVQARGSKAQRSKREKKTVGIFQNRCVTS